MHLKSDSTNKNTLKRRSSLRARRWWYKEVVLFSASHEAKAIAFDEWATFHPVVEIVSDNQRLLVYLSPPSVTVTIVHLVSSPHSPSF
ncbi:hypothetical protein TNCT_713041 [Trichonephila clavata]|uniref:Uncharacterized protein n=1 Tax=Trichonephila clavata TaxID=2740835 RepID=A0A8X6I2W5_TRICU|nr:hypothetical protein TNCT_713041 [Trichonephila clavata]